MTLFDEMMNDFKNSIKTTNGILLLFNGQEDRLSYDIQLMLRELEMIIGKGIWNHIVLGFSFWSYDERSILERNITYVNSELFKLYYLCC